MTAPFVLFLLTILFALLALALRNNPMLASLFTAFGAAFIAIFVLLAPIDAPVAIFGLSVKISGTWSELGRSLILDPNTGDILAASSYPLMDTRRGRHRDPALWINRNFNCQFEPGSVFKIFSTASLLRNSAIDTATVFNCDNVKTKGLYVYNAGGHDYGNLSLMRAFSKSSNVYWGKAVGNLRKSEFYRDLMDFGFGQDSYLVGEARTGFIEITRQL